ncbi:hypothetical protein U1Q18_028738 [Sarracenia purpurea var. burkii]
MIYWVKQPRDGGGSLVMLRAAVWRWAIVGSGVDVWTEIGPCETPWCFGVRRMRPPWTTRRARAPAVVIEGCIIVRLGRMEETWQWCAGGRRLRRWKRQRGKKV